MKFTFFSKQSSYLSLILLLLLSLPTQPLSAGSWEQQKIIYDLQNIAEKTSYFRGCSFYLLDPDLPEHADYYLTLNTRKSITQPLLDKLENELKPKNLHYFHQFQERINYLREHGAYKKGTSDYCLLYAKQFYTQTKPVFATRYQRYYEEDLLKCNNSYSQFCNSVNTFEYKVNRDFLKYYALGYRTYDKSKAIYDHGLVQLANGDVEAAVSLVNEFLIESEKEKKKLKTEELLHLGVIFIESMNYKQAATSLTNAIETDPFNKEAYFQRAVAHLETGLFNNALDDFQKSEKGLSLTTLSQKSPNDFNDAFLNGLIEGSSETLVNFFPSLYSFAYANMFHPVDSLTNYINACYSLMKVTAEYLKEVNWTSKQEGLLGYELSTALLEPGLKRLYEYMDDLSPVEQGHLLGHVIGAYGTDFIAGVGLIKGIHNCTKLANACKTVREAGRIYEFETLAQVENETQSIIACAHERMAIREAIIESAKTGKIVIKTPNAQLHIMQEKHGWHKVVQLTGNLELDFKSVVIFLEEHDITNAKNLHKTVKYPNSPSVTVSEYHAIVNGCEIEVFFENYEKDGLSFFKNGWVVTKK